MRNLLLGFAFITALFLSQEARAQAIVLPCVPSGNSCIPVSAANPLPTTGGGGGGSPGGSNTQVQYNNSSAFGGTSAITTDGTNATITTGTGTITIGGGSALTSSGAGGALGSNAFTSTAYAPLASPTFTGTVTIPILTINTSGALTVQTDAAGILALSQGLDTGTVTNPAAQRTYNNASSALTNFERGVFGWTDTSNVLTIGTQNAGTGVARNMSFVFGGTNKLDYGISNSNQWTTQAGFVVASGNLQVVNGGGVIINNSGTLSVTGTITNVGIGSDATHTDTTVCQDTTSHLYLSGSGTAGICLGNVSSIRFKEAWTPLSDGLFVIMALNPGTWRYRAGVADGGARLQVGFLAEEYGRVLPDWTRYDDQGRPNGDDLLAVLPQTVRAIQQLKADNDNLHAEVEALRRSIAR